MHFLVMSLLCDRALAVHFNPTAPNRRVESYHSSEKKSIPTIFSNASATVYHCKCNLVHEREIYRGNYMGCYGVELTGGIAAGQTLDALADMVTLKLLLPKEIP